MSKKKRAAGSAKANQNGGLLDQARQIAEGAFQDLQKRLPQDLVKQLEKSLGQGQKTLQANVKRVQDEVRRTARQADVDKLTKRIDGIAKQLQQLERAVGGAARSAATSCRRSTTSSCDQPRRWRSQRSFEFSFLTRCMFDSEPPADIAAYPACGTL